MLVHIKDIINQTEKRGYAVGAFNIHNFETVVGVARAAVRAKSPAIIQVSESAIRYMGLKTIISLVSSIAKDMARVVPVALHLDHGRNFDSVFECIKAGFTSVHIDASHLPLPENIMLTQKVVEIAHAKNVWVQGEVGAIIGGHGEKGERIVDIPIAKVDEVVKFVKETGVDTIAAAVGTAHGVYKNEDIKIPLVSEIKQKTKIPFVLHGGSGVPVRKIKEAIKAGVNIINIGTDIKTAFSATLIKTCLDNRGETDPRFLLKPSIRAVEETVVKIMRSFGSAEQVIIDTIET